MPGKNRSIIKDTAHEDEADRRHTPGLCRNSPFHCRRKPERPVPAQKTTTSLFTPEQENRIGEVAADYLLAHPDILVKVSQELETRSQQQQMQKMATAAIASQKALLQDKDAPSYGPSDAGVVVVGFFDYQCV